MSNEETQQLIVTVKREACARVVVWTRRLQHALDARSRLLEGPSAGHEVRAGGAAMTATAFSLAERPARPRPTEQCLRRPVHRSHRTR